MAKVFISYSHEDRDIAELLAAKIRAEGLSAWIDRDIEPGDMWRTVVQRELADMRCMVVIWTSVSVLSHHVIEEAAEGKRRGCLLPLQVGVCDLPYGFREIQSATIHDALDSRREAVFHKIAVRALAMVQGGGSDSTSASTVPAPSHLGRQPAPATPSRTTRRRDWLIGGTAVSALGVALWAGRQRQREAVPSVSTEHESTSGESSDLAVPIQSGPPLGGGDRLRIAFTAAAHMSMYPEGEIWEQIMQKQPDLLLLLGNSTFLDAAPLPANAHPRNMTDAVFQEHAFRRWTALLENPSFQALTRTTPVELLQGENDYLWANHTEEKATRLALHAGKVSASRALFRAVRACLDSPTRRTAFPAAATDAALWRPDPLPPGYRSRQLNGSTLLHLPDYQTVASGRTLLGASQRTAIETTLRRWPLAVHLLTSPTLVWAKESPSWFDFDDIGWLRSLSSRYRILALSGAGHVNSFRTVGKERGINANASGAAVAKLVTVGAKCRNFALLDIDPQALTLSFFSHGTPDSVGQWKVDRDSWTAASVD